MSEDKRPPEIHLKKMKMTNLNSNSILFPYSWTLLKKIKLIQWYATRLFIC
jgi:hypothetical protein